jgi:5-(carboxyamino)imidazole ribonucleotide mutase
MSNSPLVGIIMGSDSDWETMKAAVEILDELGISHEAEVVSAHRMPEDMVTYAKTAANKGIRVIIAGAGGAAHLPGMVASITTLPVIGVPVPLQHLDGLDSLLSIVQMPAGVPVATVGIGNAKNAGLLAARIIASAGDEFGNGIASKLDKFQVDMRQTAIDKGDALKAQLANQASQDK